ncbi:hypothetical protein Barb4_05162 [Bacteroidales bacterium Barb4]|nr:hypothetical protein Barb4_05162 [Bacteroidales bacterium Barb4]
MFSDQRVIAPFTGVIPFTDVTVEPATSSTCDCRSEIPAANARLSSLMTLPRLSIRLEK